MITGPEQKPPPHSFYGDNYERGLDPMHSDALPPEFRDACLDLEPRAEGWYLLDSWENVIGWCADGTEFPDEEQTAALHITVKIGKRNI